MEINDFDKVSEFGPVSKWEKIVDTPMEGADGYTTEENRQVCYLVGNHVFKVSKVSNRGWTVTHYKEGELKDMHMEYEDGASEAHTIARSMVEDVVNSRTRSSQQ